MSVSYTDNESDAQQTSGDEQTEGEAEQGLIKASY